LAAKTSSTTTTAEPSTTTKGSSEVASMTTCPSVAACSAIVFSPTMSVPRLSSTVNSSASSSSA